MALDRTDRQNLAVALVAIVLIGVTAWVMIEMRARSRLAECLEQRRRNCEQLAR